MTIPGKTIPQKAASVAKGVGFAAFAVVWFGGLLIRDAVTKAIGKLGGDE